MFDDHNCRRSAQSVEMASSSRWEIWSQPVKSKGNLGKACSHLGESLRNQTPLSANLCLLPFWSSTGGRGQVRYEQTENRRWWRRTPGSFPSCLATHPSLPSLQQFLQTFTASRKTREAGNSFPHQGSEELARKWLGTWQNGRCWLGSSP